MADPSSLEKGAVISSTSPPQSTTPPIDQAAERRLLRKLDFRILPILWILYLVNFIDRANIGNAKIQGMEKDLHLINQRFNICVWVFNLGYLAAGIPLQLVFKHYGPKSLCVMIFCWGFTVIGCGLVRRWEQLVVCRLLEGMAESAFISGAAYLIGAYYTNAEYLTRYVWIYTATIIAGAINGFLSSLIAKMDGVSGAASWPIMPPFPEKCNFLSPEEKALMLARVEADGGHALDEKITFGTVMAYFKDWKILVGVVMYLGVLENANSLANFQPTIIKGLGYNATQAQVHTIPVYVVGAVFTIIFAYISERLRRHYYFYMLGWTVLVAGLAVELAYPPNPKVRYMAVFFIASGCYLAMPISLIWVTINSGRGLKRAVTVAAVINFGTAGAFISSNVFLFKETPRFHTGFSSNMGMACMGAFAATITWIGCRFENKKRDQRRAELPAVLDESVKELGDHHPDFRFEL